jgi:hypothetical protein
MNFMARVTRGFWDRCCNLKILSPKEWRSMTFLTQHKVNYAKFNHNIGFGEKCHFFAKNCRKSMKIVIKTPTPEKIAQNLAQRIVVNLMYSCYRGKK